MSSGSLAEGSSLPRICLLADSFVSEGGFGIARYCRSLHAALVEQPLSMQRLSLLAPSAGHHGVMGTRFPRRLMAALWALFRAPDLERFAGAADLVHALETGYPVATSAPLVSTIHDLGPLTHPQYFAASHPWLIRAAVEQAASRALFIICPSGYTADAVREFASYPLGDRVVVVPHGVDPVFFSQGGSPPSRLPSSSAGAPFLLFSGAVSPRKNVARVLSAFASLEHEIPHHLLLTGRFAWSSEAEQRLLSGSLAQRVHLLDYVTEAELVWLYQHADAYLYPSLLEGFGLPVLEAMAGGCPVVTSRGSSLEEVAGGAAELVEPESVESIRTGILSVLQDCAHRERLSRKGREHAQSFTWSACAARMVELYGAALERSGRRRGCVSV